MSNRMYYSKEAEMQANREKVIFVGLFLAAGIGVGAVLALLFAPKSGVKTREDITSAIEDRFGRVEKDTSNRFSRLEKDLAELGKRIEDRLADIRR